MFLNAKVLSVILLIGLIVIGVLYYREAESLMELGSLSEGELGAGYFPRLMAITLIILSIISIIQTLSQKESEKIELGNWKMVIITIVLTAIYIYIWSTFGYFYIITFFFLFGLLYLYQVDRKSKRKITISVVTTMSMLAVVYVFFDLMLNINF